MPKLVYIVTTPETAKSFLRGQLEFLQTKGFSITLISSPGLDLEIVKYREQVSTISIPMQREISPLQDLRSIKLLVSAIKEIRPDIVNAGTPKAGFLGMIAATIARVPVRIYQLRGLRLETTTGFKRLILSVTERIASYCAHYVVCNSSSLLTRYAELRLAPINKLRVIGSNSSNSVDPKQFESNPERLKVADQIQQELKIDKSHFIFGFVGRLTRDKGISELVKAFELVNQKISKTALVLIGSLEQGDPVPEKIIQTIEQHPNIYHIKWVNDPSHFYYLIHVLVLPSYREGFPNVPLEAAIAGRPTVGFKAIGVVDAIRDGETGILVPVGSIKHLEEAMIEMVINEQKRLLLGRNARQRALTEFNPQNMWKMWLDFYLECVSSVV